MHRPRVLLVDDRQSVLDLMTEVLQGGYELSKAQDGASALALVGATQPAQVVVTDVRMPGATGFEVLRAVRDRAPGTAVVVMTAFANVADAVAAMRLGAFDYIAKPLDPDEMALVVARAVEHALDSTRATASAADDARAEAEPPEPMTRGYHRAVEAARARASREYLARLMLVHNGNVTQAAKSAALTRESLHRVLRKYGVRPEDHRDPGSDAGPARAADGGYPRR